MSTKSNVFLLPGQVDVAVVGAGQAGLSAGFHLKRRGFLQRAPAPDGTVAVADAAALEHTFIMLDANPRAGGAWQHRWRSLTMSTINGIYGLPGMQPPQFALSEPAVDAVPRYFETYEAFTGLQPFRPVAVDAVSKVNDEPKGPLAVSTSKGTVEVRVVINATGTWTRPFIPYYPGNLTFIGRQIHVADYVEATQFAGERVAVVGGGISAVQLIEELSHIATTFWFTRSEPEWHDESETFDGSAVVSKVDARVRAGLPPNSVVSVTGLHWTPALRAAAARGALDRHPMFARIEPNGLRMAGGSLIPVNAIIWATGFRAALDHLAPLRLRNRGGGIVMDGTRVSAEPRVHLLGYGPSASTVGANRAGRAAVSEIVEFLG